jgi:hypothetical protein
MFCHLIYAKRLGGYARTVKPLSPPPVEEDIPVVEEVEGTPKEQRTHNEVHGCL